MTFIIAEAGVNHNGDIQEAHRLIVAAKRSGADAVKFQYFNSLRLWGDDRIAHLELTLRQMQMLKEQADRLGIEFMCTAFDVDGLLEILPLLKRIKISSGLIVDQALLDTVDVTGLPVMMSTGMATLKEIGVALSRWPRPLGARGRLTLLQCTSIYPCPPSQVNLRAMVSMRRRWHVPVGLSDHTTTVSVPIAAVAMGATVIEKHLTLDRNAEGPDHKASLEPHEFAAMVVGIRQAEEALGTGRKRVMTGERELRRLWHVKR